MVSNNLTKVLLLCLLILTILTGLAISVIAVSIGACGTLSSNTAYILNTTVTANTNSDCFEIPAANSNITFDCDNLFVIANLTSTPNIYGFDMDGSSNLVKNCNFLSFNTTGSAGIFVTGTNNQIVNITDTNGSTFSLGINNAINTTLNNTLINTNSLRILGTSSGVYINNFTGGITVINTANRIFINGWTYSNYPQSDFATTSNYTTINNLDMHNNNAGLYLRGKYVNITNSNFYNSSYFIVLSNATNVYILNLTVRNISGLYSVGGDGVKNLTIINSSFYQSTNINLFQSTIFDNLGTLLFEYNYLNDTPAKLDHIDVKGTFYNNSLYGLSSVRFSNASNLSVNTNFIIGNGSIRVDTYGTNISIFNNSFHNSYAGFGGDGFAIRVINISNFSIYNNSLTDVLYGIATTTAYNGDIYNNSLNISDHGILLDFKSYNVTMRSNYVENSTYAYLFRQFSYNNTAYNNTQYDGGIFYSLHSTSNNIAYNNYIDGNMILLDNVTNEYFYNNTVTGNLEFKFGTSLNLTSIGAYNNTIQDSTFGINLTLLANSTNNNLINVTFQGTETIANFSSYYRKWYFSALINDTNANLVQGANVSVYNNSENLVYTGLADASGLIGKQTLTEYFSNGTKYFQTNYTVNVTNDGHLNYSTSINLTTNINSIITLSIIAPIATVVSSAGGGSSGGGLPRLTIPPEYLSKGYNKMLAKNWEVKFEFNDEIHTLIVTSISDDSATITISPVSQTETLLIGQEKKFDLNSDNYYDLLIKLNSVSGAYGAFSIKTIYEAVEISENKNFVTQDESIQTEIQNSAQIEEKVQNNPAQAERTNYSLYGIIAVIIAVIIVSAITLQTKRRK